MLPPPLLLFLILIDYFRHYAMMLRHASHCFHYAFADADCRLMLMLMLSR